MKNMQVAGQKVRIDSDTGYICITDISKLKGQPSALIPAWLRTRATIKFIAAWETKHNPDFNTLEFEGIKNQAGDNTFFIYAKDLINLGCKGIVATRGKYGGTYCAPQWAIHFANWLDEEFYLETLDSYLQLRELYFGADELKHRFVRELSAKNYTLITGGKGLEKIPHVPSPPTPNTKGLKKGNTKEQIRRRLNQFDADIINLAIWGMTAMTWRTKFPDQEKHGNMRNLATNEELQVLNTLQAQTRQLQKEQYNQEEKLQILLANAAELLPFYCDTPEKEQALVKRKKERGW
jgi:hypothetical protein